MNGDSRIEQLLNILGIAGEGMRIASGIVISLGIILILGFSMTRLTKLLKLPNVIAYLLIGIIIGPSILNLIPGEIITRSSFISDVALVFVAFTAGEFFKFSTIKKSLGKAIAITAIESVATFALIFALCFLVFRFEAPFSLVLAALASATAPTSTIMTIKQTNSKGNYVTTLLEVLAIDGVFALVLYTISISIFVGTADGTLSLTDIVFPLLKMLLCLVIGVAFGFALRFLISSKRTTDNRLIIIIAVLLLFCGVCSLLGQSPLLGGIAIGAVYTNSPKREEKLFAQVNYFMPPLMLIFFVRGGMCLDFSVFTKSSTLTAVPFIVIVLAFLAVRSIGKYGGTFLGSVVTAQPKETRNFLGFGLIPQASVAIALATMAAMTMKGLAEKNPDLAKFSEYSTALLAIILASSIIFELIGPVLAKLGLYLSHSYGRDNIDELVPENVVKNEIERDSGSKEIDLLAAQINHISKEIPPLPPEQAEEEAFTEAAEEYSYSRRHGGFINRK